ncbi:hypothetical protein BDN72DRAFT_625809 [Pluteus cervinus]|uniref:Uncharacterized protein n=1 Tax=Pluteus cervinus TaxID=181527 RepID=A0ACD3A0L8_9AGAR|nr:hypothetical protein BDN72DRAFT_625809 [Pluteus cervinus]
MPPQLPHELLQEILQLSAGSSLSDTFRLLTLSRWVYQWSVPLIIPFVPTYLRFEGSVLGSMKLL